MQFGPFTLANTLALAPMAGVTDRPFRALCRRLGAGLTPSEMLAADTRLRHTPKSQRRMSHEGEPQPRIVQIVGADPAAIAEAARYNYENGADVIDINMGCPAKKVCSKAAGSALMRDERVVARILEAAVAAVPVPVTLKMRTGWSVQERNAVTIARIAEAAGVTALAVHGRTRACGFRGAAEYETIRAIKAAVRLPVLANGDIDTPQKARAVLDHTGADGLMIGRAAQGRPWIFREIRHYLDTGRSLAAPPAAELRDIMLDHLVALYRFYGDETGVRVARKHIGWYCRNRSDAQDYRFLAVRTESPREQIRLTNEYFRRLADGEPLAA
jgi:tRNA-dihydrouridine synthase B